MILDQTLEWTTPEAYFATPPSWTLVLLWRLDSFWLAWQSAAMVRREAQAVAGLRDACSNLPEYLRRDIGLA